MPLKRSLSDLAVNHFKLKMAFNRTCKFVVISGKFVIKTLVEKVNVKQKTGVADCGLLHSVYHLFFMK